MRVSADRACQLDILQIRRLDRYTPCDEIMKALNNFIESGYVRHISACTVFGVLSFTPIPMLVLIMKSQYLTIP